MQQTPNTQAARQLRFGSLKEITTLAPTITAYVYEAIEVEKAGLKADFKPPAALPVPEEFAQALTENPALQTAFEALTAGRQRGYLLHFASPKLAGTRAARVEKCTHKILEGKGLND